MSVRHGFMMRLKPGAVAEYKRRHDAIWPELTALLQDAGISNYSIFLDESSLTLFACLSLAGDNKRDDLPQHPIMKKWWASMAPLMETDETSRPLEWPLSLMFHME